MKFKVFSKNLQVPLKIKFKNCSDNLIKNVDAVLVDNGSVSNASQVNNVKLETLTENNTVVENTPNNDIMIVDGNNGENVNVNTEVGFENAPTNIQYDTRVQNCIDEVFFDNLIDKGLQNTILKNLKE